MTLTRTSAKQYFEQGDKPTQSQFAELFEGVVFQSGVSAQAVQSNVSAAGQWEFLKDISVSGNVSAKTLNISGAQSTGALTVNGVGTFKSDVSVSGNITAVANITVSNTVSAGNLNVGNLTGTGTISLNFPASSSTWSPGYTGFAVNPTDTATYQKIGKRVFINIVNTVPGTSNATTFTITGLPFTPNSSNIYPVYAADAGTVVFSTATVAAASTTITMTKGAAGGGGGWTNSGNKFANISLSYETP